MRYLEAAVADVAGTPLVRDRPLWEMHVVARQAGTKDDYGNHTSAMMVSLPADLDDPIDHLMAIHESAAQTKAQHRSMGPDLLEQWAALIPPWVISTGATVVEQFGLVPIYPPCST